MSSIGTFGGFTAARLGIYTSQKALETTGNNISNINTPGYTRQRVEQISLRMGASDRYAARYDAQVGQGALITSISQLRDPYLDIRYRAESATLGFTETTQSWLSDVQAILDEVGDGDDEHGRIYAQLEAIETALRSHSDHAGEKEYNTQVRNACESLTFQINEAARKLNTTKTNAETSLEEQVEGINEILTQIRDLNVQIRKSDIHGDNALEMRDTRNVLLDQLSTYMDVDIIYSEESFGPGSMVEKLTIKLGNANPDPSVTTDEAVLVDGEYCTQFSLDLTEDLNPEFKTYDRQDWYKALVKDARGNAVTEEKIKKLDENVAKMTDAYAKLNKYLEDPSKSKDGKPINAADQEYVDLKAAADTAKTTVLNSLKNDPDLNVSKYINPDALKINDEGLIIDTTASEEEQFKYLNKKGEPVELKKDADLVYTDSYSLTISELRAKNDKILKVKNSDGAGGYYYLDSMPISLDDNDLYGALQALREFLTEEGEFASEDEITNLDENAATKRGIKYYQKSLDLLARKFADSFNEANQDFLCNDKGDYIDQDGNVLVCPTFDEFGRPEYQVEEGKTVYKDADGNVYVYDPTLNGGVYKNRNDTAVPPTEYVDNGDGTLKLKNAGPNDKPIIVSGVPKNPTALNKYGPLTEDQKEWLAQEAAKGVDENGNRRLDKDGKPVTGYPAAMGGVLFSNAGDSDDPEYITAENISISMGWASEATKVVKSFVQPSKLANMEEGTQGSDGNEAEDSVASTANLNILHMVSLLDKTMTYNPQDWTDQYGNSGNAASPVLVKSDFNEMVNNIGTVLGNDMRNANIKYDTSNIALTDLDMARDSVSAVDLNDEAMNLMQYSKSYSAACRLMTTLDEVLDRLINNTGLTR